MRNRVRLQFLSYCLAWVLGVSLLPAGISLAFGFNSEAGDTSQSSSGVTTISGLISDSHCGARHPTETGTVPSQCARVCARRGAKYVVIDGDTTYVLLGNITKLDAFAGQRVQITGTLRGNIFKVVSIQGQ